jgi:hypothetical protein
MDLNNYIMMNTHEVPTSHKFGRGEFINHVTFKVLHSADKDKHDFIPESFKELRVINLIDYCVENNVVHKNNIFYHLSHRVNPKNLQLNGIVFKFLSLVELTKLSKILPAEDILEYIKFKPSEPYHTVDRPDKVCYDLYCDVSWFGTLILR